ncbi:MAG TPA: hypothetical protein VMZ92_08525 [Planctomycetota bacterium]|nr:hypothetical protein [Planctomycetota bacterium]
MARTKDPGAATLKAWETRRRNQEAAAGIHTRSQPGGGGGVVQQRHDWKADDVGSERLTAEQKNANYHRITDEWVILSRALDSARREKGGDLSGEPPGSRLLESYWQNYREVNRSLREPGYEFRNDATEVIVTKDLGQPRYEIPPAVTKAKFDAIFSDHALIMGKEETLFRGDGDGQGFERNLTVGSEIADEGWISTSLDPEIAHDYAKEKRADRPWMQVIFRITAPAGTRYLPGHWGHQEMILKRGTRFLVTGIGRNTKGVLAVDMEVIG